jgi:hypothetical protein
LLIFKGGPKFLFWGDQKAMSEFAGVLRASAVGNRLLGLQSFSDAVDGKSVVIQPISRSKGLRMVGQYFEWTISKEDMDEFAELVDGLAESTGPGHQFLKCGADDEIVVMVSKDEYPPDLRP